MSEHEHFIANSVDAVPDGLVDQDDIQEVLAALQQLAEHTRHPVVRACLEQARDDILHLTSCGDASQADEDGEPAAA